MLRGYGQSMLSVFCLSDAPNAEAAVAVHKEAHGLLADEITQVSEGH